MKKFIGFLLAFFATASWGVFYIVGRWLFGEDGGQLDPYIFTFLRFTVAVLVLTPVILFRECNRQIRQAIREDWLKFIAISTIGIVIQEFLAFYSLNFTTASRSSLMANCSPIATVILSFFLLKEKISRCGFIGMCLGFIGIILCSFSKGGDMYAMTGLRSLIGDAMALGGGFCWAFFTVYGTGVSQKYNGLVCMFLSFAIGAIIMSPVLCVSGCLADIREIPLRLWCGIFYTGAITMACANVCWYAALRYLKPNALGAFGYLSASITFVLSAIVLKETFSFYFFGVITLTLSGMAMMMTSQDGEKKNDNLSQ